MKFIQKSRIETFLKYKGYCIENDIQKSKDITYWSKPESEKVIVPEKDIIQSNELLKIFMDENLLNEFRKY
ncbi:MAG TPA: hypothetical protein VNX01_10615 [Bacteroidia bacterium]|nr:hypothetical protein [Bacteroidia bacterium]